MSGALYQLQAPPGVTPGSLVRVDGPHDTWGRVLKLQESGYHLIRGLGHKKPLGVAMGSESSTPK